MATEIVSGVPAQLQIFTFKVEDVAAPEGFRTEHRLFAIIPLNGGSMTMMRVDGANLSSPNDDEKEAIKEWFERMSARNNLIVPGQGNPEGLILG